jgi:hypothetical protein
MVGRFDAPASQAYARSRSEFTGRKIVKVAVAALQAKST